MRKTVHWLQQGFAGARRADQQCPFRNTTAEALKFGRVFQKLDDFLQIIFGFIDTCDIVESDAALRFIEQFGF